MSIKSQSRRLTKFDFEVLQHFWRWKVVGVLPLYEVFGRGQVSFRRFWKKFRRLVREGYIEKESGLESVDLTVYRLSKKGFDHLLRVTDYIPQKRFRPQSIYHDYLVTAFQTLCFYGRRKDQVAFWTEQEINVFDAELFPSWATHRKGHIPDGYTLVVGNSQKVVLAIEVEISEKVLSRYIDVLNFYDDRNNNCDLVLWLVRYRGLARKVINSVPSEKSAKMKKHLFFLERDFMANGMDAKCFLGAGEGKTLGEIYWTAMGVTDGSPGGHSWVPSGSPSLQEIYFANVTSPKGFERLSKKCE